MPRTAVWPTVVVAHHHPIRLNHQHARRRLMRQLARRRLRRLHLAHRPSLLAFAFGSQPFSMRPQRLTANLDTRQLSEQRRRFAKRGARRDVRLPAGQPGAGALSRPHSQRPICPTPALPTPAAAVARASERQPAQACFERPTPPPLGGTATTAARARTPRRSRLRVGAGRGGRDDTTQHRARLGSPGLEHAVLVHFQRRVAVLAHMRCQPAGKSFHRWYDLRWKVGQIEHWAPSLRPARVCSTSGSLRDPTTLPGHALAPVVPAHFRSHPHGLAVLTDARARCTLIT